MKGVEVKFNTDDVTVYIAGAGSGKTTALMAELTEMLREYRPDEIAFTTFTRKGVLTGIERALSCNDHLREEDLVYFQTLHRMCYREAKVKRKNIIEPYDIARFNRMLGFKLSPNMQNNVFGHQTEDDKILQRYDAVRSHANTGIYVHGLYDEERYNRLVNAYEKFKSENDLVDFYDCLLRYREIGSPLPIAAFFLDEAQDVTPLQWEVIELASRNAKKIRIGGDPAQAIFSYQGASPDTLISLAQAHTAVELNDTYRLPKKVCKVADSIISLMDKKIPRKHVSMKDIDGHVRELADKEALAKIIRKDFEKHSMREYRWFCLFRTNCHISMFADMLERSCIPYHTAKGFCLRDDELLRVGRFLKYRQSGYGMPDSKQAFMDKYEIESFDVDFTDTKLIASERRHVYAEYAEKYGIEQLVQMASRPPFCLLTTTYKVKGGEADNVAVFLDATKTVANNMLVDLDGELRVFYVACTRARDSLFIVNAERQHNLEDLWHATVLNMGGL